MQSCMTVLITLVPSPSCQIFEAAARRTSVVQAPLLKQLLGLKNARWVSVHEVDVRLSFGKLVPLRRLQEI